MIQIHKEPKSISKSFGVYENCIFNCGNKTKYWNLDTNKPICKTCADKHNLEDLL